MRKKEESNWAKKQKDNSLKESIKEGCGASIMTGAGQSFIIPYALALSATNLQIGILNSFIGLISPLIQLKSSRLIENYSRKKIVMIAVLLQALMWIPIMLLSLMLILKINFYLSTLLIIFYTMLIGFGAIATPAWFSWMGDLVNEKKRGEYFSKRNRILSLVLIITMLGAGFILDFFKTKGLIFIGFAIIFSIAMFARLYSVLIFKKHYEPKIKLKKDYYFSLAQFTKRGFSDNFGKFVLFATLFYLAVSIASPFFTVYMINELGFSYFWFTLINVSISFFTILTLPFWGKFSDRYGNRLVIVLSGIFIPLVPFLWMVSTSKIYILLVPSLIGGIFWGAFNLSMFNFIYDSVNSDHRAICATYYNFFAGLGIFIGSIIGGMIAKFITIEFTNIFILIFFISGVSRAIISIIFLPQIKEVKKVRKLHLIMGHNSGVETVSYGIGHFHSMLLNSSAVLKTGFDLQKNICEMFEE